MSRALRVRNVLSLALAVGVAIWLARRSPTDQTIHYVLGNEASRVEELDARWDDNPSADGPRDWVREAKYRYQPGTAPRIITHEPRLRNGDYLVELEVALAGPLPSRAVLHKHIHLTGGVTYIDVGSSVGPSGD